MSSKFFTAFCQNDIFGVKIEKKYVTTHFTLANIQYWVDCDIPSVLQLIKINLKIDGFSFFKMAFSPFYKNYPSQIDVLYAFDWVR